MQDQDTIDRYFTHQIVGAPCALPMGASQSVRQVSDRGVRWDGLTGRLTLVGLAGRSLWSRDPARLLAGRPLGLPELARWRRRWMVLAGLGWVLLAVWVLAGQALPPELVRLLQGGP